MAWNRIRALICSRSTCLFLTIHFLIICSLGVFGWESTWVFFDFGKRPLQPHFIDLHTIKAAPEAMAMGLDPLVDNPTEDTQLPMNYPRIWAYAADYVHLNDTGVTIMGAAFWLLFVLSVLLLIEASGPNARSSRYTVTLALMPACWYTLIEGNNDLLIFFLVVVCCRIFATSKILSLLTLTLAVVLKIFPIVVFPVLLHRSNKKAVNAAVVATFLFCTAYLVLQLSDLYLMRAGNTASAQHSYGFGSLWGIPTILPGHEGTLWPLTKTSEFLFFLLCAAGAAAIAGLGFFHRSSPEGTVDPVIELFFMAGTALYTGTFILSANWDYRLVILVLCAPYIATMPPMQRYATLAAAIFSMNFWSMTSVGQMISGGNTRVAFVLLVFVQLSKCLLFGLLAFELGRLARQRLVGGRTFFGIRLMKDDRRIVAKGQ
jgi:Glycosyltransferase family 87